MKLTKITLAALFGALAICISPVFGELSEGDQQKDKAEQYSSSCNIPAAFTDPEVMATTMSDPAKFVQLWTLMNNPQTTQALLQCSMDSEQWSVWMANFSNPTKMMNAMIPFMNPQTYTNWMTASMNPQTYQPMYAYMNPAFYTQWMTALMNPAFYQPMYQMMDPKWQQESTAWMMDPKNYQQMFEAMVQAPVVADATVTE